MSGAGGALEQSVTLEDVFAIVASKRVPLAPELAGYLVLEIAEHADPQGGDVDPKSVFIGEEGSVALVKRRDAPSGDAESSVRAILARLLESSGAQTPALAASSKRKSGAGLPALSEELEAALIPVNRSAGRRALARLAREVKRVTMGVGRHVPSAIDVPPAPARRPSSPPLPAPREPPPQLDPSEMPAAPYEPLAHTPSPSQADVDKLIDRFAAAPTEQQHARDLKAMVGLEATPPPPPEIVRRIEAREAPVAAGDTDVEALLAASTEAAGEPKSPRVDDRGLSTRPAAFKRKSIAPPEPAKKAKPGSGGMWLLLALVAIVAGAYFVWRLRPGAAPDRPTTPSNTRMPLGAPTLCRATLVVTDVPPHAEVLLREGQAPVDIERMPVGARLEFVATAEGFSPKRAVVGAGATWDTGADGKSRFEIAVQLDKSRARPGSNDPWPAGEPGTAVGGQGPPGTVHVASTPRGAEVWMLAGLGPEARIEQQLGCDQDVDVLVAGPTSFRKRLHLSARDFVAQEAAAGGEGKDAARVARVSAK